MRAGFGPEKRAAGKIESGESTRRRNLDSTRAPVKTAGDHQMENEPEVVFEADADAFAESAEVDDSFPIRAGERWGCGAEQKRADDADSVEGLAEDAAFEGFDVNSDVGEFRHEFSKQVLQIGAVPIVHRRRILEARAVQVGRWFAEPCTRGCGVGEKMEETGRRDRRKLFVEVRLKDCIYKNNSKILLTENG